jgi:hypothetical protein
MAAAGVTESGPLDGRHQVISHTVFQNKRGRAGFHGPCWEPRIVSSRAHDDIDVWCCGLDLAAGVESINARHFQVEDHDVWPKPLDRFEEFSAVADMPHDIA